MMRGHYLWILLLGLLKVCSGDDLICQVDEVAQGVLYWLPTFKGTECIYSWRNKTDHVLAHQKGMLYEHVLERTNHTLLLKKCLDVVLYARSCFSEGGPRRVICNASCSWNSTVILHELPRTNWTLISIIIVVLVLVGTVLILCIVFRDRICRRPHCYSPAEETEEQAERRRSMDTMIPLSAV